MATQFASIAPIPFPAPKATNVRVVYSASRTAAAVDAKLADLPEHKRDATLEELAVSSLAEQVIKEARELLSPPMFSAFIEWAKAATLAETFNGGDDDATGDEIDRLHAALRTIGQVGSVNSHDIALKTYIAVVEYGDCPSFGPLVNAPMNEPAAQLGLVGDLLSMSPLLNQLNELAATAWSFSPRSAFARNIGDAIAGCFARARVASDSPSAAVAARPWHELAEAYLAAKADEDAHDQIYCSIDESLPVGPERNAAIDAIPQEHWDESERLIDIRINIETELLSQPSETAEAFALKVLTCRGQGRGCDAYDDMLAAEARKFARAATDDSITFGPFTFTGVLQHYRTSRRIYETYYRDVLVPAEAAHRAVVDQWPQGYDFQSDPAAKAALDAVDYDDQEEHGNDLVSTFTNAMIKLLLMPAPGLPELAIKVELLKKEEAYMLSDIKAIIERLAADTRALCGVDAYADADASLLTELA
ncbi:hypothetical protein [Sphingomonas sp. CARO-RG-8B-R24-01]|uniref:hypothetical protein n=1 Tax=Sphingomonas sp. CARO-RG-8B-R24-01 TaxID=2914831 RepID=UPI001F5AEB39|nr:hypothetical protein [Sphingomonas sp. CARO-RG-8B-R24-01]